MSASVLVCAGFEPAGRVGLLADLEAIRAHRAVGWGAVTALTAQGPGAFLSRPVPPAALRRQISAARTLGGRTLRAVKLGMVPTRAHLAAIRGALRGYRGWWVVDPVTRTSRGECLSALEPRDYWKLAGRRVLLTPNLPELAWLSGEAGGSAEDMAGALLSRGFGAVLVKGGHARGERAVDVLVTRRRVTRFAGPRLPRGEHHRGTGCRFASALAVGLASGEGLEASARRAKRFVARYLET